MLRLFHFSLRSPQLFSWLRDVALAVIYETGKACEFSAIRQLFVHGFACTPNWCSFCALLVIPTRPLREINRFLDENS
jgi:hypothetical protein